MLLLLLTWAAQAQDSRVVVPDPVAGHPVFELRVGVDRIGPDHPYVCGELAPLAWLSVEGCGTGSGFLHQGDSPDMAHFRARARVLTLGEGRARADLLVGAGFAEVQRTVDRPGFRFGKARDAEQVEGAGPEASLSVKGRYWLDGGGKTYATADLNAGVAVIPSAPTVMGVEPVIPFAALTVGLGF